VTDPAPKPPIADIRPHLLQSPHGERIDPYYWLRDDERRDPEVLAYLQAENAYFEAEFSTAKPLENTLFDEIVARLKQDDASVPYRKNGFWYYTRFEVGKEHPIFARRADLGGGGESPEEILLDANQLSAGHDYYQIGSLAVSPNSRMLAFCEDIVGRREYRLRFKDLSTGLIDPVAIERVEADLAWANDNCQLFYVEKDPETLLGISVKKHRLGTDPAADRLVFGQTDLSFYTNVSKSKSERYIFIQMESTVASEWRYADADDPALEFKVFLAHERDHEYQIEHLQDRFIVRSNWRAKNFRLMQAPIGANSDRDTWGELVPHDEATFLEDFKRSGFYLDDLVLVPVNKLASRERSRLRWGSVSKLADRLKDYRPEAIVILMRAIEPMVLEAMRLAGISYEPYCTPHPAFGNWNRFHIAMTEITDSLPVIGGNIWKDITA